MKMAKELYDEGKGGLYYDHKSLYREPDPFESVNQFDNIKAEMSQHDQLNRLSKVNHPKHYNSGKIEVIDAIEDWGLDFNAGNVVKYVARHQHKANAIEDLKKARWFLDRIIERLEKCR